MFGACLRCEWGESSWDDLSGARLQIHTRGPGEAVEGEQQQQPKR